VLFSVDGYAAAKPSFVMRPRTSASLEQRYSACMLASSWFQNGAVHAGSSTSPSRETYIAMFSR
jgi:hypothetical protein